MPLYVYRCIDCGRETERLVNIVYVEGSIGCIRPLCEECGGETEKQPTAPSIQFKGSGWTPKGPGRRR